MTEWFDKYKGAFSLTVPLTAWQRSMLHGRLEAERTPASAGLLLGRLAASLTPLSPLYSTGPRGTV